MSILVVQLWEARGYEEGVGVSKRRGVLDFVWGCCCGGNAVFVK